MGFDRQFVDQLMRETDTHTIGTHLILRQITIIITFSAAQPSALARKGHTRNDQQIDCLGRTNGAHRASECLRRIRNHRFVDTERSTGHRIRPIIVELHRIALDPWHDDPTFEAPTPQNRLGRRFVGQSAETCHAPSLPKCRKRLDVSENPFGCRSFLFLRQQQIQPFHCMAQLLFRLKIGPFHKKSKSVYCYSANNGYLCACKHAVRPSAACNDANKDTDLHEKHKLIQKTL